jgi:hypothetical protein
MSRNHSRYFCTSDTFWSAGRSHPGFTLCFSSDDPVDHLDTVVHLCKDS